jgi:recombination protein RecR
MLKLPRSLERLITELGKLPGIGAKSAQRLAFYLLKKESYDLEALGEAVKQVKSTVVYCSRCHNMADTDPCVICKDTNRDQAMVCVVEEPMDAIAIDRSGYRGIFHVLGGVLNPLEGIGAEQLNIQSLQTRVQTEPIKEVIIATNPTLEGETTAMHIHRLLEHSGVHLSRIARGLPMGGDLEYADEITLTRALEGRRKM